MSISGINSGLNPLVSQAAAPFVNGAAASPNGAGQVASATPNGAPPPQGGQVQPNPNAAQPNQNVQNANAAQQAAASVPPVSQGPKAAETLAASPGIDLLSGESRGGRINTYA